MHFTLKQLRYFDAARRTGSIARAAREMNISQSSITAAIDQMEQFIGLDLFRRIPAKGLRATEAGQIAGQRVAQFLDEARLLESDLMSVAGKPSGTLLLACYAPTAPFVLPLMLKQVTQDLPEIRIDLREGDMSSIATLLSDGAVDMALTYRWMVPEGAPFLPLFGARPFVLVPEGWDLAQRRSVELADLVDLPMVMLDLPGTQDYFFSIFRSKGLSPRVVHTTKSSSVLRGLVAADFGYSILNICGHGDRNPDAGYVARPIAGDVTPQSFGIAYNQSSEGAAMVQAVLHIGRDLSRKRAFDRLSLYPPSMSPGDEALSHAG